MTDSITFQVLRADELSLAQRAQIIDLGAAAYDEPFDWLFDMLPDSTHLLGRQAHDLVCHAAWVTRWFEPEGRPMLRAAYIEAVATAPEYQGRGLATALMREVATLIGGSDADWRLRSGWSLAVLCGVLRAAGVGAVAWAARDPSGG